MPHQDVKKTLAETTYLGSCLRHICYDSTAGTPAGTPVTILTITTPFASYCFISLPPDSKPRTNKCKHDHEGTRQKELQYTAKPSPAHHQPSPTRHPPPYRPRAPLLKHPSNPPNTNLYNPQPHPTNQTEAPKQEWNEPPSFFPPSDASGHHASISYLPPSRISFVSPLLLSFPFSGAWAGASLGGSS